MKKLLCSIFILCLFCGYGYSETSSTTIREVGMVTDDHAKVHKGEMFTASMIWEDLADNASVQFLIDVATTNFTDTMDEMHLFFSVASGGDAFVTLLATCTIGNSSGTTVNTYDFNSDTDNTPMALIYSNPNILSVGTTWQHTLIPGGSGGNANGGSAKQTTEFVLEGGLLYAISIKNVGGAAKSSSLNLNWYEIVE